MGDMADYYLDLMWDDPYGEEEDGDGPPQTTKACRCCGKGGLHWINVGKWRLAELDGKVHVCPVAPLPQVIKLANGSKITAAKSPHNPVRGFAPSPTDEDIPL